MNAAIEHIRDLIRKDDIEKAIAEARAFASTAFSNELILIANRYQKWKKEKRLGIGDNPAVRNSAINDLLALLSDEEQASEKRPDAQQDLPASPDVNPAVPPAREDQNPAPGTLLNVFVSYAHKDVAYLEDLKRHFKPLRSSVRIWDDTHIAPGSKWHDQIKDQIKMANVAILLISADFFNSDFILDNELPPLLKSAEKGGTQILSIILKPCWWDGYPEINQYQALNSPTHPVSSMDTTSRESLWVELVKIIRNLSARGQACA